MNLKPQAPVVYMTKLSRPAWAVYLFGRFYLMYDHGRIIVGDLG